MKLNHVLIVFALLLGLPGCTVNNYYGNTPQNPAASAGQANTSDQLALIEKLKGVHLAVEATMNNLHSGGGIGYHPQRADFINGESQPTIWIEPRYGELVESDNELHIAISGAGFLEIEHPGGESGSVRYTRNGRLALNRDGELVWGDKDGPRLTDGIVVTPEATAVQIAQDGMVHEILADGSKTAVGQITLHRFEGHRGLRANGNSWYAVTDPSVKRTSATPGTDWMGTLVQGQLEHCKADIERECAEVTQLLLWQNELANALDLSAGDRYQLSHHPVSPDFFEKLVAEAK